MQLINLPCLATGFLAAVLLLGDICFSMVLFLVDLHKMLGGAGPGMAKQSSYLNV